jgi:hypothetical protein
MGRILMGGILMSGRIGLRGGSLGSRLVAEVDFMDPAGILPAVDSIIMHRVDMVDEVGMEDMVVGGEDMVVDEVAMADMAVVEDMVDEVDMVVVEDIRAVGDMVVVVEEEEDTAMVGMAVDPLEVDTTIINPANPSHQTTLPTTQPPAENPPQQSTSQT